MTLVSGSGGRSARRSCAARASARWHSSAVVPTGGASPSDLADTGRRYMLEEEGLNAWGIWDFSKWDDAAAHLKKGFEYGKQRCTAYPRYVVQRELCRSSSRCTWT